MQRKGMIAIISAGAAPEAPAVFQPFMNQSTPANLRMAETTPMRAPPAMKPLAMSVPFSWRLRLSSASLLLVLTNQEIAPPTSSGRLRSMGMNIPRQNARAGTLKTVRSIAITAPIP